MNSNDASLWAQVERAADQLVRVITGFRIQILEIERDMIDRLAAVNAEGQKCLSAARRIVNAVEKRLNTMNTYLQHGTEADLRAALKISQMPLILANDPMSALISEDALPPIDPAKLQPTLENLLSRVVVKKQRMAF